jgi:biopolymer transport protein ExbB
MKKQLLAGFSILTMSFGLQAQTLDNLLITVQKEQKTQTVENNKRELEFVAKRDQQKKLLEDAKKVLAKHEAKTKSLTGLFEKNEKTLAELENKLNIATGTLGEMFGVVKQISGDLKAQFENSVVSVQLKGRDKFIGDLAQRKALPNIDELKELWFQIMGEVVESGKVVKFKTPVIMKNGEKKEIDITRVGSFNLIAGGKYFVYQGETKQVTELARQPDSGFLSMIEDFETTSDKVAALGIDPSRGTLLSMLVNAPSLSERLNQGGIVGYVILCLLAIGLVIVGERMLSLNKEKKKIHAQLTSSEVDEANPLGQLMAVFDKYKDKDIESLELKMDESILKSLPKLEKGIGTVKILAAVAPLMGLLGTVTGMIGTFQSITLFGTGDPKLMAGGISTALITTVLGLVCAIPLLLLHNVIAGKSKELVQILEEQSAGLLAQKADK